MERLFLMRHAEAESAGNGDDWQRQLTKLGRQQVCQQGHQWRELGFQVDGILYSSALRACDTAHLLVEAAGIQAELQSQDKLYHASAPELLIALQQLPVSWKAALLVGHLPAVANLAYQLLSADTSLHSAFPPATLVVIRLPENAHANPSAKLEFCLEV